MITIRYEQRDPTPEEIAEATAKIRATWSEREKRKRRVQYVPPVELYLWNLPHGKGPTSDD